MLSFADGSLDISSVFVKKKVFFFSNGYLKATLLKDCLTGWLRTNEINHK